MKKAAGLMMAGAAIFLALLGADQYAKFQANKPFEPTEDKHFVKIDQSVDFNKALETLGVKNGESFEILSYSCPACKNMEPLFDHVANSNQIVLHKFHLGGVNDVAGKAEYMVKHQAPADLKDFRAKMYDEFLSASTAKEKESFALTLPLYYGITADQVAMMDTKASEYTKAINDLADAVDLKSTPSLYLGGQYYIVQQNHKTGEQFMKTISHVLALIEANKAK